MGLILFLLMFGVPLIEVALFMIVGSQIGVFPTLLLCVATAVVGAFLVQRQGLGVIARALETLSRGRMPVMEISEGVVIAAAGVLLMTPGFFTDAMGFLLLAAPVRRWTIRRAGAHIFPGAPAPLSDDIKTEWREAKEKPRVYTPANDDEDVIEGHWIPRDPDEDRWRRS